MLNRLRAEMEKKTKLHEELVKKYEEKMEEKKNLETELLQIEKEIIHNQGAMQTINDLGVELMEQEESLTPEEVEVIEN